MFSERFTLSGSRIKCRKNSRAVCQSKICWVSRRLLAAVVVLSATGSSAQCPLTLESTFAHAEIGPVKIFRDTQTQVIAFVSQMQVNTDGAPDSYHPDDIGITHTCNGVSIGSACTWKPHCLSEFRQAKAQGFKGPQKICFFAMATDARGVPIIQGPDDPKPGYFVSTTALHQPGASVRTPQAQLDSNTVPYAVIPGSWQTSKKPGPQLGDVCVAYRRWTGQTAFFVIGDTGPRNKVGEVMKFVRQQSEDHTDSSTSLRSRS